MRQYPHKQRNDLGELAGERQLRPKHPDMQEHFVQTFCFEIKLYRGCHGRRPPMRQKKLSKNMFNFDKCQLVHKLVQLAGN